MDSRKAIFALLAGAALTAAIGILLTPYKGSSRRKEAADSGHDSAGVSEGATNDPADNGEHKVKQMDKGAD
ncbi:MAG: hypothetical protein R3222_07610, partial [Balneolaceae bacterium]|nr:hypothetical protein [Balneolaceae bacterium]